jgi:hypothetical protein
MLKTSEDNLIDLKRYKKQKQAIDQEKSQIIFKIKRIEKVNEDLCVVIERYSNEALEKIGKVVSASKE